ncbi:MAG TPA: GTP cyclohydrolase I FolE2 [Firmicutes bacterium]|nr:GTP cyclohydrolase I FolE2 [Bacillota bacterium]HPT68326.1 GTP cyclohydrolase FolE2 [Bacillota bacterium]
MKDVQNYPDLRGIAIQQVGIKNVHLPVLIATKAGGAQSTLGEVTVSVDLPKDYKGTHLSRFMEVLVAWQEKTISGWELKSILKEITERLNAACAELSLRFRYFLPTTAPVSGSRSLLDYKCEFWGRWNRGKFDYQLGVEIPVVSLCPCSKSIAKYGAHNQRAFIRAWLSFKRGQYLWIEDAVALLEKQGSCQVYPLLKREDEKAVTEAAYENPKFVEDILRDSVLALRSDNRIRGFRLEVESFESIHNHSAFARHEEELG